MQTAHQLTPQGYRAAFDLKGDYPIVAHAYAARPSAMAKSLGSGRKPGPQPEPQPATKKGAKRAIIDLIVSLATALE